MYARKRIHDTSITVRLSSELKEKLKKYCSERYTSLSKCIRDLIENSLK